MQVRRGCVIHGKNAGLDGDLTTTGAVCYASRPGFSVMGKLRLYVGDKTSPCPKCGQVGVIVEGDCRSTNGASAAVDGSAIRCGCPVGTNVLIAPDTVSVNEPPASSQYRPTAKATSFPRSQAPEALPLPARIYTTQHAMDDYQAKDMQYGDLDTLALRNRLYIDVDNVSVKVNPRTRKLQSAMPPGTLYSPYVIQDFERQMPSISKDESASLMFDEFRELAKMFSFQGEYQNIITDMINHMQGNSGKPYSSPLLDKALKEQILADRSEESSLLAIKNVLNDSISYEYGVVPLANKIVFERVIKETVLPKFNRLIDNTNGLVISVHDSWATHITLLSLEVYGDSYRAKVHYRIQDHFGLDDADVLNPVYREFRIFRLWFALQRWDQYGYRPFITEMNATVEINGRRGE